MPYYGRVNEENMLDNPLRCEMYNLIAWNPGMYYNLIKRGMNTNNGTVSYNLKLLEDKKFIRRERGIDCHIRYYPYHMPTPEDHKKGFPSLQQARIYMLVKERQRGITVKRLEKITKNKRISRVSLFRDIKALLEMDFIVKAEKKRNGSSVFKSNGRNLPEYLYNIGGLEHHQDKKAKGKAVE